MVIEILEQEIITNIANGDYDLVLADVNLDSNPDISFLNKYIYSSQEMDEIYTQMVNETDISNLPNLLCGYMTVLSEEVGCIGIYSKVGFVVTQKSVLNMSDISYMNIFKLFK